MDIINILDEGLLLLYKDEWEKHHPRKSHYVTELTLEKGTGRCLREQYFDWANVYPTDLDPTRLYYTEVGKILHENLFSKIFERTKLDIIKEYEIEVIIPYLKYPIHGKIDYIIDDVLIEIKTTQGKGITNKNFGIKYQGAKEEHKIQLAYYLTHTVHEKAFFIYFGRDNFYRTQIELECIDYDWELAYKRWQHLEECVEKATIPKPDYTDISKYPCSWCVYNKLCQELI